MAHPAPDDDELVAQLGAELIARDLDPDAPAPQRVNVAYRHLVKWLERATAHVLNEPDSLRYFAALLAFWAWRFDQQADASEAVMGEQVDAFLDQVRGPDSHG